MLYRGYHETRRAQSRSHQGDAFTDIASKLKCEAPKGTKVNQNGIDKLSSAVYSLSNKSKVGWLSPLAIAAFLLEHVR